ncbi:IS1096 element passenger TnpR family protein [Flavobacterium sp.]|uniref:IS1096 element passenger TnpR family protein n=1 Tax=Flavobacterium sp. TaxID=239 RepID=UPI003D2863F2
MIYKFRVILDAKEDIFRDIAIEKEATLEDLHNTIVNAFGFDGSEMASFYTCDDEWNQEDEIPLFDTGDVPGEIRIMNNFILEDNLDKYQSKIIYVYDFFNMWTFLVELAAIEEKEQGETYPTLLFSHGELPEEAPDKKFEAEDGEMSEDDEDLDMFEGDDSFEDYGFEENWN